MDCLQIDGGGVRMVRCDDVQVAQTAERSVGTIVRPLATDRNWSKDFLMNLRHTVGCSRGADVERHCSLFKNAPAAGDDLNELMPWLRAAEQPAAAPAAAGAAAAGGAQLSSAQQQILLT